eukprot:911876-Alexandrium_andersonii.AAC.1
MKGLAQEYSEGKLTVDRMKNEKAKRTNNSKARATRKPPASSENATATSSLGETPEKPDVDKAEGDSPKPKAMKAKKAKKSD